MLVGGDWGGGWGGDRKGNGAKGDGKDSGNNGGKCEGKGEKGVEAYSIYATEVVNHLEKVGGKTIFFGEVKGLLIGEVEESWEWVAIAEYPSASAMYKMFTDSDYIESEKHRSAGLKGQLNIITQ